MAHGTVTVTNPYTEEVKVVPVGFSWTVLFFGAFPALFRQDWMGFGIMAGILILTGFLGLAIIPLVIFAFIYNDKMHLKKLLDSGWKIKPNTYVGSKNVDVVSSSVGYNLNKHTLE